MMRPADQPPATPHPNPLPAAAGVAPRRLPRRAFLGRAAGFGLGGLLWGVRGVRAEVPPSARFTVGVIGCGGMGQAHLSGLVPNPQTEVVAVCDVDANHRATARAVTGDRAAAYGDHRELLAHPDLDVVCIATPDHWHAGPTTDACRAGIDVYVEKPLSHNVAEGRAMVDAARRFDRVVQVGTMQRAWPHFRHVVELVRNGRLGPVERVVCWFGGSPSGDWTPVTEPPPELDWDRWLGPAPRVPYQAGRCHFTWRYHWDYGGGMLTDWGVHLIDIAQWAMGEESPLTIDARGWPPAGAYETPEWMEVRYNFPSYELLWSQLPNQRIDPAGHPYGVWFEGRDGQLFVDREGFRTYPVNRAIEPIGEDEWRLPRVASHWHDFLSCVLTRQRPASDVAIGHRSTVTPQLGNISYRVGRPLTWNAEAERFVDDPVADRLLSRPERAPYG